MFRDNRSEGEPPEPDCDFRCDFDSDGVYWGHCSIHGMDYRLYKVGRQRCPVGQELHRRGQL